MFFFLLIHNVQHDLLVQRDQIIFSRSFSPESRIRIIIIIMNFFLLNFT